MTDDDDDEGLWMDGGRAEGGLTGVYPSVGLEVGALGVDLLAAVVVTHVDPPPLHVRRVRVHRRHVT